MALFSNLPPSLCLRLVICLQWAHCFHIRSYPFCPSLPTCFCDFSFFLSTALLLRFFLSHLIIPRYISQNLSPSSFCAIHPGKGQALITPSACNTGYSKREVDGLRRKCWRGGRKAGEERRTHECMHACISTHAHACTHNSQVTIVDWRGPRKLSSLEHLIPGLGPNTTISMHNWHRPPETLFFFKGVSCFLSQLHHNQSTNLESKAERPKENKWCGLIQLWNCPKVLRSIVLVVNHGVSFLYWLTV